MVRRVASVPRYGPGRGLWRRTLVRQANTLAELGPGGAVRLGSAPSFFGFLLAKACLLPEDYLVGGKAALPSQPVQPAV